MDMKRMMVLVCALVGAVVAFADESVQVTVSETGSNRVAVEQKCETKAKKMALRKYLEAKNPAVPEQLIAKAESSYENYAGRAKTAGAPTFAGGKLTASYTVKIKESDLVNWLKKNGYDPMKSADGSKFDLVIAEEPPTKGSMKVAEAFGTGLDGKCFFFIKYEDFQRGIRDALTKQVAKMAYNVKDLADNPAYADMREYDPLVVGAYFDPEANEGAGSFKLTKNFFDTIRDNDPNTIVLYYRIVTLDYDKAQKRIRVQLGMNVKNCLNDEKFALDPVDFNMIQTASDGNQNGLMADFVTCVNGAITKMASAGSLAKKLDDMVLTMRAAAEQPSGPMKVVFNCSKVDKDIVDEVLVGIEDGMVAAKLCDEDAVVTKGSTITCTIKEGAVKDMKRLWIKVKKILTEAGLDEDSVKGDIKSVSGNTMTVKPGKDS